MNWSTIVWLCVVAVKVVPLKVKNPGEPFQLAGVWNHSTLFISSGCPIGELCRNNRYSDDYDYANYDYVKKSDDSHIERVGPVGRKIKREL